MDTVTDTKELNDRIATCHWRADCHGTSVCRSYCLPCRKVVEKGNCEIVADYFKEVNDAKKKDNSNDNQG